ncbi:MAG: hypothetical protein WCO26_18425, partial [Deltaproteobacteria bacterium]
ARNDTRDKRFLFLNRDLGEQGAWSSPVQGLKSPILFFVTYHCTFFDKEIIVERLVKSVET